MRKFDVQRHNFEKQPRIFFPVAKYLLLYYLNSLIYGAHSKSMMTNFGKSQSVVEGKIELSPVYRVLVSNILFSYQKLGLYLRKGWFSMVHDLIASFNVVFTLVIIFSFLKLL